MDWQLAAAILVPVGTWAASVEYRLGQLLSMKATVDKLDEKTDKIMEILVEQASRKVER